MTDKDIPPAPELPLPAGSEAADNPLPAPPLPPLEPLPEPPAVATDLSSKMVEAGEPWNVMNMLAGHAAAMNSYAEVKAKFDENFPNVEAQPLEPPPSVKPTFGSAISAGRRITPDPTRYVIDRDIVTRTERRRH